MNLNTLRQARRRVPFRPFTMRLADGRSEAIDYPESVAIGPRIVLVARKDNSWLDIEPLLIVSIDYDGDAKKGGNGATRRKKPPSR